MIVLRCAAADNGDGVKITIDIDGVKNTLTVSADDFLTSGIKKGDTDFDFDFLQEADKRYAARRAALRIISAGQCSAQKLYQKLRSRGFSHECAKNASDFVKEIGYIDEEWQIESYLKELLEKRYIGRRKLIPMLLAKGYSASKINAVIDENYTDRDFAYFRQKFLEKKFGKVSPDTREEALEMKKALYKQGY